MDELKSIMSAGKETSFWLKITEHLDERVKIMDERIEQIKEQILNELGLDAEDEKKLFMEERDLKNKRAVYLYLKDLPDILSRAEKSNQPETDPY